MDAIQRPAEAERRIVGIRGPERLLRPFVGLALGLIACTGAVRDDDAPVDAGKKPPVVVCPDPVAATAITDPRLVDDACLFDRLLTELPALSPAEQHARVAHILELVDAPLRSGTRVVFIAPGRPDLAGSFNGWDPAKGSMTTLAGSGYAYREETLPPGRHAYKFVTARGTAGETWTRDPAGKWLEFDGVNTTGVGEFNSVVVTSGAAIDRGVLRLVPGVKNAKLSKPRDAYVLVPAAFFDGGGPFDTLYVNDGNESLSRSQLDRVVDASIAAGTTRPLVAVFVALHDQTERFDDYTFGTDTGRAVDYADLLADTLVPVIDSLLPTKRDAASRGVAGASLGGLVSAYAAWLRTDTFHLVGSQSGSFFWPEPNQEGFRAMVEAAASPKPLRFYLDCGTIEDGQEFNERLETSLGARGYDVKLVVQQGADHDWAFWKQRFPGLLAYLFPPKS